MAQPQALPSFQTCSIFSSRWPCPVKLADSTSQRTHKSRRHIALQVCSDIEHAAQHLDVILCVLSTPVPQLCVHSC